jgi:glutathione S-transferase
MRVQGSRAILRELELRAPEPPLLPAGGAARAGVEAAEAWGDVVLQSAARRIIWAALRRAPEAAESLSEGADLPVPPALARASMPLIVRLETALNGAWDANARADLAALPGHLDRIEAWMGEGALGGEAPTAADLQIGPALALLHTLEDLHPLLDRRACEPARRWFAGQPGRVPAGTLPAAWLPARLRQ